MCVKKLFGGGGGSAPALPPLPPPPPPPPEPADPAVKRARDQERQRARQAGGRSSTILAGLSSAGTSDASTTGGVAGKTLLGA